MTDEEYQNLILSEMQLTEDITIVQLLPSWWALQVDQPTKTLQYLYTKRAVWEYLINLYREAMDSTVGPDSFKANQLFQNAKAGYQLASEKIAEAASGQLGPGIIASVSPKEAFEHPYARARNRTGYRCSRRRC